MAQFFTFTKKSQRFQFFENGQNMEIGTEIELVTLCILFSIFEPKNVYKAKSVFILIGLECQSRRCILSNIIAVTKHKNDIDVVQCHETIVIAIDGALCRRFSSISFSLEWCVQLQWSPHWAHVTFTQLRSNLSQMHSRLVIRILPSVANYRSSQFVQVWKMVMWWIILHV